MIALRAIIVLTMIARTQTLTFGFIKVWVKAIIVLTMIGRSQIIVLTMIGFYRKSQKLQNIL